MSTIASNQISVTDITDAYSIFMDNENYSFMGDVNGNVSGSTICNIRALRGNTAVSIALQTGQSIKFYQGGTEIPSADLKFQATFTGDTATAKAVTITAITGAVITSPIECRVPLKIDGIVEITKVITLSSSNTGASGSDGVSVTGVQTKYQLNNVATAPSKSSGTWGTSPSIPTLTNKYLWAYDITSYSSGSPTETSVRLASQYVEGSQWLQGTVLTGTGTGKTGVAGKKDDQYLNSETGETYVCTATGGASGTGAATWNYSGNIRGATGADAITVTIESSDSTVFKTGTDSTDLTPTVRYGKNTVTVTPNTNSATCTIDNITYNIKWKKGSTDITTSKGKKNSSNKYTGVVTITGADVDDTEIITCTLETQS